MAPRGKWAQGITPRHFTWIVKERLAVCERPGGYGDNHRKVRRQEEIIWIREQGFTTVMSLIVAPQNLHNYDELGVSWLHRPFSPKDDPEIFLRAFLPELRALLADGGKVLIHQAELGDRMAGLMGAYLLWSRLVPESPQAISITEQLMSRQLESPARQLVALAARLPGPDVLLPQPPPAPPVLEPDDH